MESILLMTGFAVGGALVFPAAMEWLRKYQVGLALSCATVLGLYCMAPYSPVARNIVNGINVFPQTVSSAVAQGEDGISKMHSEYFRAFR